jgi:formylglycine-generating enzyme required for sulfatase activity
MSELFNNNKTSIFSKKFDFEPDMVFVEGGTFKMGSNFEDSEMPIHDVHVNDFYMSKFLCTQSKWLAIMDRNPSIPSPGGDYPVNSASWQDVQVFIKKLNAQTNRQYRLPTEAEWEFAARGGNKSNNYIYSGSNDCESVAWLHKWNSYGPYLSGKKQVNELGIYDMSGNVWELCEDWYKSYPGNVDVKDFTDEYRVIRGGYVGENQARSTCRTGHEPDEGRHHVGFRLAITNPNIPSV